MKKLIFIPIIALIVAFASISAQAAEQSTANKKLAENFWNGVFNNHNTALIDSEVGNVYKQHNPFFADGKAAFKEAIEEYFKEFPESSAEIKHIVADGDLVFIHNHIKLNPQDRGQSAVDIFRVTDGKITEHWDVIQAIPEQSKNTNSMF